MDSVKTDMKNWKMPPCADDRFEWRSTMNSNMQTCNPHLNGKQAHSGEGLAAIYKDVLKKYCKKSISN